MSEELLESEFSKFGPIHSVKVMWPRSEAEKQKGSLTGFVCFRSRRCAEEARQKMQGFNLLGKSLVINWGKSVAEVHASPLDTSTPKSAKKSKAKISKPSNYFPPSLPAPVIVIAPEPKLRELIDRTALFVAHEGSSFEISLKEKELTNPNFSFLFEKGSRLHHYYVWKVYSLLQGDSLESWRLEPFRMFPGGPFWFPPPLEGEGMVKGYGQFGYEDIEFPLPSAHKRMPDEFLSILKKILSEISVERDSIKEAMGFSLDHSKHSYHICLEIEKSILKHSTPVSSKIALLFLISDIIANSSIPSVPNASTFRSHFQKSLPSIFDSLYHSSASIQGRVSSLHFKEQISRVLNVWSVWNTFTPEFIHSLQSKLDKQSLVAKFSVLPQISLPKKTELPKQSAKEKEEPKKVEQVPVLEEEPEMSIFADDVDGVPLDEEEFQK